MWDNSKRRITVYSYSEDEINNLKKWYDYFNGQITSYRKMLDNLSDLENYLDNKYYIQGTQLSQEDLKSFDGLNEVKSMCQEFINKLTNQKVPQEVENLNLTLIQSYKNSIYIIELMQEYINGKISMETYILKSNDFTMNNVTENGFYQGFYNSQLERLVGIK